MHQLRFFLIFRKWSSGKSGLRAAKFISTLTLFLSSELLCGQAAGGRATSLAYTHKLLPQIPG
jgi:hypothetical protein